MPAVALSPKAGAHGEFCGMLAIKAALEARGEAMTRKRVLVPIRARHQSGDGGCGGFHRR
jgi:glycine dehydrogenase subunit 2